LVSEAGYTVNYCSGGLQS